MGERGRKDHDGDAKKNQTALKKEGERSEKKQS